MTTRDLIDGLCMLAIIAGSYWLLTLTCVALHGAAACVN